MQPECTAEYKREYRLYIARKVTFCLACLVIAFLVTGFTLSVGNYEIGFLESYRILLDHITGNIATDEIGHMKDHVIWDLRMPRAFAGLFVGAGLGVCGAVMQSTLKNPLADPYTTGISSGASLGATLAIVSGFSLIPGLLGEASIVINAFIFSLIPACVMIFFSIIKRNMSPESTILIGVAVMYVFTAITTLLKVSATEEKLAEAYVWSVGTLGKATPENILAMGIATVVGVIVFTLGSNMINTLAMDDKNVTALGEDPKKIRLLFMFGVSLVTAVLVSFTGTIGFVGLVAPHIVRLLIGSDNRYLIPASACFGAMFLLCADCLAKNLSTGLPVGVVTALVGGPLFLFILLKMRKAAW